MIPSLMGRPSSDDSKISLNRFRKTRDRGLLNEEEASHAVIDELVNMRAKHVGEINALLETLPMPVPRQVFEWASETSPWPSVTKNEVPAEIIKQRAEWLMRKDPTDRQRPPGERP